MTIDSRIALNLQPLNVGQRFSQNVQNLQQVDLLNQRRDLAPLQLEQAQRANELANAQQPANLQAAEFAASGQTQALLSAEQEAQLDQFHAQELNTALASGDPRTITATLNKQLQNATKFGLTNDIAEAQQALQMVNQEGGLQVLQQATTAALTPASQRQRVTASKILDDGTTIQSLSTGGTNVVSAQGDVLTGEARKTALDNALKSKVTQKGDIAQTISDVKVDEAIRLEKETVSGKQSIESKQINIDETKIKNAERKKQAIDSKNSRRVEADNASLVVSELLDGDAFSDAFGRFNNAPAEGLRTQANIDARSKVDQVVGLLSLESRQKLKGQGTITDSEAKTLEKSATVLTNPLISDNVARKELRRVKRIFEDASDRNQLKQETKEQSEQQEQQQSQVLNFDAQGNLIQ